MASHTLPFNHIMFTEKWIFFKNQSDLAFHTLPFNYIMLQKMEFVKNQSDLASHTLPFNYINLRERASKLHIKNLAQLLTRKMEFVFVLEEDYLQTSNTKSILSRPFLRSTNFLQEIWTRIKPRKHELYLKKNRNYTATNRQTVIQEAFTGINFTNKRATQIHKKKKLEKSE